MIARYETNDLHLAATLQCLGLELLEVNRSDPRRVRFVFEDDALRREWTREYLAGGLRVDPLILLNSFRSLKRQIYADAGPANRVVRVVPHQRAAVGGAATERVFRADLMRTGYAVASSGSSGDLRPVVCFSSRPRVDLMHREETWE